MRQFIRSVFEEILLRLKYSRRKSLLLDKIVKWCEHE